MSSRNRITFISAGAGSGKTYRLTEELEQALLDGTATPAGILGTTFTVKAAAELGERVRERLLSSGHLELAERLDESLIGTVHSVCERLLRRFAFELGLSPQANVMSVEDGARLFNQALDQELDLPRVRRMDALCRRLGMVERGVPQWPSEVKALADRARENNIAPARTAGYGKTQCGNTAWLLRQTAGDRCHCRTAPTPRRNHPGTACGTAQTGRYNPENQGFQAIARRSRPKRCKIPIARGKRGCSWPAPKPRKRRRNTLAASAKRRCSTNAIRLFSAICATSCTAYTTSPPRRWSSSSSLKRERGLLDFADIEQLALRALNQDVVRDRLRDEIDLLLVDEFQDTNPMQLALFRELSKLAKRTIFVGDVKQAIYGFRGCDPELVFDTRDSLVAGGADTDVLTDNWRSQSSSAALLEPAVCRRLRRATCATTMCWISKPSAPPWPGRWLSHGDCPAT